MRSLPKRFGVLVAVALAMTTLSGAAASAADPLEALLASAAPESGPESEGLEAKVARFVASASAQDQMLADVDAQIAAAVARRQELTASFERNAAGLQQARAAFDSEVGELAPLFESVRQAATDTAGVTRSSLVSAQLGPRDELARRLEHSEYLPSIDDFRQLQRLLLGEAAEAGRVVVFSSPVVNARGVEEFAEVLRVGVFTLSAEDRFLHFDEVTGSLQALARQPRSRHRARAAALVQAEVGPAPMAIDPTLGAMPGMLSSQPDIAERLRQGGIIGFVIVVLGAFGFFLALYRLGTMLVVGARVRKQLGATRPDARNPLGRVLNVYAQNADVETSVLELQLDEAILKELPRLEKWQGAIKVIAAVAPLLGLLGTVTGMIETFQAITLSGNGDPQLMAGGISQALITTVLGLVVAIPLVLLHSVIAGRSQALVEILEAQSAGIIARQAERLND